MLHCFHDLALKEGVVALRENPLLAVCADVGRQAVEDRLAR